MSLVRTAIVAPAAVLLRLAASLLFLALASLPSGRAQAAGTDLVRPARDRFDFGRYEDAIRIVDSLTSQKLLTSGDDLTEAWRIHALSNLYLGRRDAAVLSFQQLLSIDPDFQLDPLLVPPAAIELLEKTRTEMRDFLEPIRARRRAIAAQEEQQPGAPGSTGACPPQQLVLQRVENTPFIVNFLPLGAAQIAQGRSRVGVIFAVGQSLAVAGTIYTWTQVEARIESDGRVKPANLSAARGWRTANWVFFGAALALYTGGVIDAVVHYEESRLTGFELGEVPAEREHQSAATQTLFVAPVEGGAAAGIAGTF